MTTLLQDAPAHPRRRTRPLRASLLAQGEPMIWSTGGALAVAAVMIVGLILLVAVQGAATFWPRHVVQIVTRGGDTVMGEVTSTDHYTPQEPGAAPVRRRLIRIGNYEITGDHYRWVRDDQIADESQPAWAVVVERTTWGRFYGIPKAFKIDGAVVADTPEVAWRQFLQHHETSRQRVHARRSLEQHDTGAVNARMEAARLRLRQVELDDGRQSPAYAAAQERFEQVRREGDEAFAAIRARIDQFNAENARYHLVFDTAQGREVELEVAQIVRAYPANQVGQSLVSKAGVYASRWWEFLAGEPREANSEGGVFPAIFGTVLMTLIMCLLVVPLGVLAALYLREYAKAGPVITAVRIAINNLAGVPSIVFGVFGLGFFCYIVGGGIDSLFFAAKLSEGNPTFGKGALIWASFTLALLTLPVVIVATEEALAAVPNSMREGSYACGASKWQTIKRIVLPRALPGVMTGAILAMARGAGEVAPLMLVGAVKLAPELPFSLNPSEQFGVNRSFMHLGFHVYDLGFQSQNSQAAQPMVFTTTLLLIALIALLNVTAIVLRSRLRRRFVSGQF